MTNALLIIVIVLQVVHFFDMTDVKARFTQLHQQLESRFTIIYTWMDEVDEDFRDDDRRGRH